MGARMDVEIVNSNTDTTAWLAFNDAHGITGTFVATEATTIDIAGTISTLQAGGSITLTTDTSIEIAAGDTLTGLDITDFVSGRFLLSLDTPLSTTTGTAFQYDGGADSNVPWDKVEASIYTQGSTMQNSVDLTSTDFFGLNLTVQDIPAGGGATSTIQTSDESLQQSFEDVINSAIDMTNTANIYDVITGADGTPITLASGGTIMVDGTLTTIAAGGTIDVLRIVAPSTAAGDGPSAYASLDDYLTAVKTDLGSTGAIEVGGRYVGSGDTEPTEAQQSDFTMSFDAAGDLVMVSKQSTTIPNGTDTVTNTGITSNNTIVIAAADLDSGLLSLNPPYTVNGIAADVGDNDVYAAAVINILGGFDLGFVESSETNPNTGTTFADSSTAEWYFPQLSDDVAYSAAQPHDPTYYDQYAAVMASLGNAYGFPNSDLLAGVLLSPQDTDTLKITINANDVAPCFAAGTHLATPAGAVAVESLTIGDSVLTADGRVETVQWIGHRSVDCARHPQPEAVWPVRVAAGAFGPGLPLRDLYLSPDHAIFADGVLIPVKHLINGSSITQEPVAAVTYFHVELSRHEVVLAEGLPVESYLDTGDRASFTNAGGAVALHPAWGSEKRDVTLFLEAAGYAPLYVTGPVVARLRARLADARNIAA